MKNKEILNDLFVRYPMLSKCRESIITAYLLLEKVYTAGGSLYVAGNGGSASDCGHIAGELMKSFMMTRPLDDETASVYGALFGEEGTKFCKGLEKGLPAISLPSMTALSTAVCNDINGDYLFAQPLNAVSRQGDAFLGISTSGNSVNIVNAMMVAAVKKVFRIGLTGENKCRLDSLCDVVIHVPERETYKVQELHLPVYHALCAMLESRFFGQKSHEEVR